MTMQELEGKRVKISTSTITVKDEYGKTRGMVRDVRPYKSWAPREVFDHAAKLNASGVRATSIGAISNVIMDGKQLYYLNDMRPLENYERMREVFESEPFYESEVKHYQERKQIAEKAASAGMIVINCYILQ